MKPERQKELIDKLRGLLQEYGITLADMANLHDFDGKGRKVIDDLLLSFFKEIQTGMLFNENITEKDLETVAFWLSNILRSLSKENMQELAREIGKRCGLDVTDSTNSST